MHRRLSIRTRRFYFGAIFGYCRRIGRDHIGAASHDDGTTRIFLAMARDGLLPHSFFGAIHSKFRTPYKSTILTGLLVASAASLLPLNILADLTSIGTLFAFALVCGSVLVCESQTLIACDQFKCPLSPWFPSAGSFSAYC